ncbi:MAG: class I tRNA ligase family protein [Saprospiraceae bacterium]|nr:leucine--tRNA ligase [Saprospiraceae bacterium]MDW8229601.1 class I tRNA ligase family protein [Saprospiraceae bacterium]
MEYEPRAIEQKWSEWWKKHQVYRVSEVPNKPKFYILNMFPYPSGAGLHVGHPLGYIASDIVARYKRLRGFNVLNPMGFDAFGLPAEQYAIEMGIHPAVSTEENIRRYRQQLDNVGLGFDWSREIRTCDPKYYKWTQWIFSLLFEHYYDYDADKALPIKHLVQRLEQEGNTRINAACDEDTPAITAQEWNAFSEKEKQLFLLKYRLTFPEESFVNWCPALGTVLSNDEVKDGVSERGGHPVERKRMKQWSMRITAYAERLLRGLEEIQWPEAIKDQQRNWIGRSQGALVRFPVQGHDGLFIEIFTTRIDTIYGATFMVLAPEHKLVSTITTLAQWAEVQAYTKWTASRSERERISEVKRVTGANTGAFAINPFTGEAIPIYIADYVLAGYGTGAIMAVPSGDQRDWNFAKAFDLPIVPILDSQKNLDQAADPTKEGRYINSGIINGLTYEEAVPKLLQWLEEKNLGKARIQYKLRNAIFSRQRYWGEPLPIYWKEGVPYLLPESELPLLLPEIDKYLPTETGEPPLARAQHWRYRPSPDEAYEYEYSTMPGWAGSSWYWYRYMDPHNSEAFCSREALEYWRCVDWYIGGAEHAVGHLLYSRFWNHFLYDLGLVPEREFAKKLTNQGMIQGRSSIVFRAKESFYEEYLWIKVLKPYLDEFGPMPIPKNRAEESFTYDFAFAVNDLAIEVVSWKNADKIEQVRQTAETDGKRLLVLFTEELAAHINHPEKTAGRIRQALQSREPFFMSDHVPDIEQLFVSYDLTAKYSPDSFSRLRVDVSLVTDDVLNVDAARQRPMFHKANFKVGPEGRFLCAFEIEKMSKSKYNVVNPDDVIEQYGADCYRMYEMFLGPIEDSKPWDTKGITGVQGFLKRLWSLYVGPGDTWLVQDAEPSRQELRALHVAIKKITDDIERFSLNTCVSHFMTLTNELRALKCHKKAVLEPITVLLAPFAPHLAEELWHRFGHETTVCDATWPTWDERLLEADKVTYPVQINGKHRGNIEVDSTATKEEIEQLALQQEFVLRHVGNGSVKKIIVVPGRIVNIVA